MRKYPKISETPDKFDNSGNKLCRNCNNQVAKGRKNYCCEKCMNEFNRNNTWHFVRKDVLRRDKYRCGICEKRFKKEELEIDHIIPIQMNKEFFNKENLRTLCKLCHRAKTKLDSDALKDA